eukprot:335193-Rhodomonas_salina.4
MASAVYCRRQGLGQYRTSHSTIRDVCTRHRSASYAMFVAEHHTLSPWDIAQQIRPTIDGMLPLAA